MRRAQHLPFVRLLVALILSVGVSAAAWRAGPILMLALLLVLLTLVAFAALTIAPDAIAWLRGHHWRWWWRFGGQGPFWAGTRIPRHPHPPRMPPRGAAALPERDTTGAWSNGLETPLDSQRVNPRLTR